LKNGSRPKLNQPNRRTFADLPLELITEWGIVEGMVGISNFPLQNQHLLKI